MERQKTPGTSTEAVAIAIRPPPDLRCGVHSRGRLFPRAHSSVGRAADCRIARPPFTFTAKTTLEIGSNLLISGEAN